MTDDRTLLELAARAERPPLPCPNYGECTYPNCGHFLDIKTGWPPGMLQDDDRKLSRWLSNRIDSRRHAREAAASIGQERE